MSADLERRYRRLLAVYPWEHRRTYEEEMLGVLLAGARPGQRRPDLRDTADLVLTGLRARLGVTARGFTEPAWADACAATGLLAALVLFALAGDVLLEHLRPTAGPQPMPGGDLRTDPVDWLRVAGWAAVCVAALAGLRRLAAGLAWAAVVAGVVLLAPQVPTNPVFVVDSLWQLALAGVAAAALTVPAPPRRALAVLGARRLVTVVLALAVIMAVFVVNRLTRPEPGSDGPLTVYVFYDLESTSDLVVWAYMGSIAVAGLALLVAVLTVAAPLRRRIVTLLAPVAALVAVVRGTLSGWEISNVNMGHAIPLVPAQWTVLVLAPVVTFLAGVLLVRRREETLRMVALGRAADRGEAT